MWRCVRLKRIFTWRLILVMERLIHPFLNWMLNLQIVYLALFTTDFFFFPFLHTKWRRFCSRLAVRCVRLRQPVKKLTKKATRIIVMIMQLTISEYTYTPWNTLTMHPPLELGIVPKFPARFQGYKWEHLSLRVKALSECYEIKNVRTRS